MVQVNDLSPYQKPDFTSPKIAGTSLKAHTRVVTCMVYQNDENKELWLKCAPPLTGWLPCVSKSGKDLLRENLGSGKQATEHFMSAEQEAERKVLSLLVELIRRNEERA